jgi:hypothetical protein
MLPRTAEDAAYLNSAFLIPGFNGSGPFYATTLRISFDEFRRNFDMSMAEHDRTTQISDDLEAVIGWLRGSSAFFWHGTCAARVQHGEGSVACFHYSSQNGCKYAVAVPGIGVKGPYIHGRAKCL